MPPVVVTTLRPTVLEPAVAVGTLVTSGEPVGSPSAVP
jgi:hypothetical protein